MHTDWRLQLLAKERLLYILSYRGQKFSANKYIIFAINLFGFKETCFMLTLKGLFSVD